MVYLAGAFLAAWLLTFGYVLTLVQRQRRLEQEIAVLRELADRRRGDA